MIYLNCEVKSGLGEDTFWTWFEREFNGGCSFSIPKKLNSNDILIQYSTLGFYPIAGKQIAYCLELIPQMKEKYSIDMWDQRIQNIMECARYSTYRVVATEESIADYSQFGKVDVIPIGVDTDLYKPLNAKQALRDKYSLPKEKKVGFWIGTAHPMKGLDRLLEFSALHPDIHIIAVWKWQPEALLLNGVSNFVKISQETINELLNASDFFISTNCLNSFYMSEWEAMAADIPFILLGNNRREFIPSNHPRDDVFSRHWDRKTCSEIWKKYLLDRGVEW